MSEPRSPLAALLLRARSSTLIVFACTAVFFWQLAVEPTVPSSPFYRVGAIVWSGDPTGFFLSIFGHAGALHFAMNMLVVLLYGAILEVRIGPPRLLLAFLVSGVAGNALGILWNPAVPSIGASGGAMGLVGGLVAFGIRSGRSPWEFFGTAVARPLLVVIGIMLALGFVPDNVLDNAAHLGGLVGGFAFVWIFGAPGASPRAGFVGRVAAAIFLVEATAYALNPVLDARYWASRAIVFAARDEFSLASAEAASLAELEPDPRRRADIAVEIEEGLPSATPLPIAPLAGFRYAETLRFAGKTEEASPIVDLIEKRHRALLAESALPPRIRARLDNDLAWALVIFDRKLDEAWKLAREAVRIERDPAYVGTLGVVALRQGKLETARELLEESVNRYEPIDDASRANDLYYLAIALAKLGDKDGARRRFERAYALRPDAAIAGEALDALGPRGA